MTQPVKLTIPPDGEWHTIPVKITGIIASSINVEIDLLPDGTGRAINRGREPIEIEYFEEKTNCS